MENKKAELLNKIFEFCKDIGLPVTFKDIGLNEVTDEILKTVAERASKSVLIRSMPGAHDKPDEKGRFYSPDDIDRCLRKTDAQGNSYS
jgi:glycerol dehydrogenase-like iron-containing ADH family enzyme